MSLASTARQIDSLLRGGFTRRDDLEAGRVDLPTRTLVLAALALGAVYGVFMGLFAVLRPHNPSFPQLLATTVKVPLLFLVTLFVTFPSLYVFSALARSRLEPTATLKLLLAAVAVNLTVLASFGPVTGFFTLSTDSYPFMVLLSVVFFVLSGAIGLAFLSRAMDNVFGSEEEPRGASDAATVDAASDPMSTGGAPSSTGASGEAPAPPSGEVPSERAAGAEQAASPEESDEPGERVEQRTFDRKPQQPSAPHRFGQQGTAYGQAPPRPGRNVLRVWVAIYAVVGAQMAWILRPFIGAPNSEFTFFRERGGNFVKAILSALSELGGGV